MENWSHCNGWPTQVEDRKNVKWSHCYGWPTQTKDDGLIMMGDLPRWKKWWSHCDGWPTQMKDERWSHYDGWPTQMKDERWSHYNGRPTQMEDERWSHCYGWPPRKMQRCFSKKWSHCYGWPTQMKKCDLPGKKTWQVKSWQDKADKRRFLIAGLISSFLWDFPTGRVHLILFSFQDLIDSLLLLTQWFFLSTILLDFI
jgi:hypothetical protein